MFEFLRLVIKKCLECFCLCTLISLVVWFVTFMEKTFLIDWMLDKRREKKMYFN
jgi:hypothetical protein